MIGNMHCLIFSFNYILFSLVEGAIVPRNHAVIRGSGYALPPRLFKHLVTEDIMPEIKTERIRKNNKLDNSEH